MMQSLYDVVIVGGGPAGLGTALALSNLGITNTLVIEATRYHKPRVGESLPPDTRRLLQQLNIWEAFLREGFTTCYGSQSLWGADYAGFNDFLFNPQGTGWHIERIRFDRLLAEQAKAQGITLLQNTRVLDVQLIEQKWWQLQLDDQQAVQARFVVDATGKSAKIARRLGATRHVDDTLTAVSAIIPTPSTLNDLTLIEAVDNGWWYGAKLDECTSLVAFCSDSAIIQGEQCNQPTHWLAHFQQTKMMQQKFGALNTVRAVKQWVAPSAILSPPAANGWLAVGDAASCFDPISAQGIYKALKHGLQSAPVIADYLQGKPEAIGQYRASIAEEFIGYLEQRYYFYQQEQRWPNSAFWQKRQRAAVAA